MRLFSAFPTKHGTKRNAERGPKGDTHSGLVERRTDCRADPDSESDPKAKLHDNLPTVANMPREAECGWIARRLTDERNRPPGWGSAPGRWQVWLNRMLGDIWWRN